MLLLLLLLLAHCGPHKICFYWRGYQFIFSATTAIATTIAAITIFIGTPSQIVSERAIRRIEILQDWVVAAAAAAAVVVVVVFR